MKEVNLPRVSVVLPTYNRAALLAQAIDSVLSQTFQDFELIVIDDGSTDDTSKILKSYSDSRLKVLSIKNHGRSHARNLGLEKSLGQLITFLDSDDLYLPHKLELQVDYFNRFTACSALYTSANCIDDQGNSIPFNFLAQVSGNIYSKISFLKPVTIALPTVMIKRDVLEVTGDFDTDMSRFEDIDLWRRVSKKFVFHTILESTCLIRTHDQNQLSMQNPATILNALDYYAKKIQKEDKDISILVRLKGLGTLHSYYAMSFLKHTNWKKEGYTLIRKSIGYNPFLLIYFILKFFQQFLRKTF